MNAITAINSMDPKPSRIIVQVGTLKFKALAYRVRKGDGHVLTRRGRVVEAAQDASGIWVFQLDDSYRSARSAAEDPQYFRNILIRKAAEGDRAAINVLDMIDENAVDPNDNYRLIELYDASKEG